MMKIFSCEFGSHLYGTNTPESDRDYKEVVIPPLKDIMLGRHFKSILKNTKSGDGKNTSEDMDIETYSIYYFMQLLKDGQTVALDMLHAPNRTPSWYWDMIYDNRKMFYTSSMQAFVGYATHQAAKYGLKSSRLHSAKLFRECLNRGKILSECKIPYDEHIKQVTMLSYPEQPAVEVVGKMFALSTKTEYVIPVIDLFINKYGERAKMAEENKGIDWKAVSHAFRACWEVKEICETSNLIFPLKRAEELKEIKAGHCNNWQMYLEDEIDKTKVALSNSGFKDKVPEEEYEALLYGLISDYLLTGAKK